MNKNEKKYRRSAFSIVCYVCAAAMIVYVCYLIGSTVTTINEYYAQYGMTAQPIEYFTYIMQTILEPLFYTVVLFMLGYILDAVRKNNQANFMTDEELEEARIAKKEKKEAKKFAKGEAAAAKAGHVVTSESSVEADFAKSLDEELKADEKQAVRKKTNKNYQNKKVSNKSGSNRNSGSGNKSEGSGNKSENSGSRNSSSGNGNKSGNGNARRNNNRKPAADKAKAEANNAKAEANKAKAEAKEAKEKADKASDVFEAVIAEPEENK